MVTQRSRGETIVTCGDWDLKTMLPKQLGYINSPFPSYMSTFCNLKAFMAYRRGAKSQRRGMTEMLNIFGLQLQGRHHSGIDDCRNIAFVCMSMVKAGYEIAPTAQISFNGEELIFTRLTLQ
jgi:inhibitor of KinA sporulation pathway (predicted exonuclease)